MAKLASDITDATLLCEQCGYVLEGLDEGGACPECGQKIAESLPSRRMGTPFQVSPGWRGFLRQSQMLMLRPAELFGSMRVESDPNALLFFLSSALAAMSLVGPIVIFVALLGASMEDRIIGMAVPLFLWFPSLFAFVFLMWLERIGVVFFSRKRGWRVPRPVAAAICANAAPAWIAAGVLAHVGVGLMLLVQQVMYDLPRGWRPWAETAAAAMPVLGFIAGMLVFETLVYIGVRRCKYANWVERPVRSDAPLSASQAATAGGTPDPPDAP